MKVVIILGVLFIAFMFAVAVAAGIRLIHWLNTEYKKEEDE